MNKIFVIFIFVCVVRRCSTFALHRTRTATAPVVTTWRVWSLSSKTWRRAPRHRDLLTNAEPTTSMRTTTSAVKLKQNDHARMLQQRSDNLPCVETEICSVGGLPFRTWTDFQWHFWYLGRHRHDPVPYVCQVVFGAILWLRNVCCSDIDWIGFVGRLMIV